MNRSRAILKVVTIVGARPQFIKAAMVSRAIVAYNRAGNKPEIVEKMILTGQHYDQNMSRVFVDEMGIPEAAVNLGISGGLHGEMTGRMLVDIEREILNRKPDWVLVYGDTNSTLAGALAATKLHVPVGHVEAGLRSGDRSMPEEINRILVDHISDLLFCPTSESSIKLKREGITEGVHCVGDVMHDAVLHYGQEAESRFDILERLALLPGQYALATVHRAANTDNRERLVAILQALSELSGDGFRVVFPLHPRTKKRMQEFGVTSSGIDIIPPASYLEMLTLEKNARVILTDSGGVQKEAFFCNTPCVTLRENTEWEETVRTGWNRLAGWQTESILSAVMKAKKGDITETPYGRGDAARRIIDIIASHFSTKRQELCR